MFSGAEINDNDGDFHEGQTSTVSRLGLALGGQILAHTCLVCVPVRVNTAAACLVVLMEF